jgi:26S proteasome regulatory subunit N8
VPFEEDENDPSIWYFDHNFLENMWDMYRKISGAAPALRGCGMRA